MKKYMKLTRLLIVVAVASLFVVGTVFAMGPNGDRVMSANRSANMPGCEFNAQGFMGPVATANGASVNSIADITGMTVEEVRVLCQELQENGQTIIDYLKEQGLYDKWKAAILENTQAKLDVLIENERITEEQADEMLANIEEKIENAPPLNLAVGRSLNAGGRGQGRQSFRGMRRTDRNCILEQDPVAETSTY